MDTQSLPSPIGSQRNSRIVLIAIVALLLILYALFLTHKINLITADLGRHIRNGELVLKTGRVASTNFYSYTAPEYPALAHHWGSGVVFFSIWQAAGFEGVQYIFIALSLATLFIFFLSAKKETGAGIAALIGIAILPMLAERTEVRPEVFSYLFSAIFFWMLLQFRKHPEQYRRLLILPLSEIAWVNTHIYFFLGPALIGIFVLERVFRKGYADKGSQWLFGALAATALATFLNPFGVYGAAAPFTIFQNYGYRVAENQPVWFIETIIKNPNFFIFKALFAALAASFVVRALKKGGVDLSYAMIALMVSAMAWLQTRNFALFGLFTLPILAANLNAILTPAWLQLHAKKTKAAALILLAMLILPASFGHLQQRFAYWHQIGIGIEEENSKSADFFRANGLRGPIFNNYDIGGYLIFHLSPDERVFVDNRPEAYPARFFRDTYIPMQEHNDVWQKTDKQYGFNAIFFSWHDATPWGQQFLANRISDPDWAPVFADQYAIIFLKRGEANKTVIERYEIPKSAFSIRQAT